MTWVKQENGPRFQRGRDMSTVSVGVDLTYLSRRSDDSMSRTLRSGRSVTKPHIGEQLMTQLKQREAM